MHEPLPAPHNLWLDMELGKPSDQPKDDPVLRALSLLCEDHGSVTPLPPVIRSLNHASGLSSCLPEPICSQGMF